MKILLPLSVLAILAAGPAFADCTAPDGTVQIPDGSVATHDEMVAAQKAVVAYDAAVKTYTDCLAQEQQQKLDAGGDKAKLQKHYAELNNAQVEKVQQLADKFNAELKAFKAKSAG
jgi:3-oxoacyl-ACP reductase-like protein